MDDNFKKERDDIRAKMLEFSRAMSEGKSVGEALGEDFTIKDRVKMGTHRHYFNAELGDVRLEEKKTLGAKIFDKFKKKPKKTSEKIPAKTPKKDDLQDRFNASHKENPRQNSANDETNEIFKRRKISRADLLNMSSETKKPKESKIKIERNFTQVLSQSELNEMRKEYKKRSTEGKNSSENLENFRQNVLSNSAPSQNESRQFTSSNFNKKSYENLTQNPRNSSQNSNPQKSRQNFYVNSSQNSAQNTANFTLSLRLQNQNAAQNLDKKQISRENLQNLQAHQNPTPPPLEGKKDDLMPEIRIGEKDLYVKTELLQGHSEALKKSQNLSLQNLIFPALCLVLVLLVFAPKVYIANNIYYLSREIASLRTQESVLSEENKNLSRQLEALRFKTQVLDYLE